MATDTVIPEYAIRILGRLPDNWRYARVGDLEREGILAGIQDGNHGEKHPKSADYVPSGVPFIMAKDLVNDRLNLLDCNFISKEQADQLRIGFARAGDVLLTHKATMGRVAIVPKVGDYIMLTPQVTYYRIGNRSQLDNVFLKYGFLSPRFQHQLNASSDQSTRKFIGITAQRDLWIPVPPIDEQRRIAAILGTLDDKIELNRRMNETLEATARAIFKSWFVDFDPVRAKMNGQKPVGMDDETAGLFPDRFQDSEIGKIPRGWSTRPLYETAEYINGAAFKSEHFCDPANGIPVVKIAELKNGITEQTKFSSRELDPKYHIDTGDLLYSWSGSPDTSLDTFIWTGGPGLLNQHIFRVMTQTTSEMHFVYYLLKYLRPTLIEIARNKQTTGLGHITVADMKRLHVCDAPGNVLAAFDRQIAPAFEKCFLNSIESEALTTIRDALLSKLLSGEIRVAEANKLIEEAAI